MGNLCIDTTSFSRHRTRVSLYDIKRSCIIPRQSRPPHASTTRYRYPRYSRYVVEFSYNRDQIAVAASGRGWKYRRRHIRACERVLSRTLPPGRPVVSALYNIPSKDCSCYLRALTRQCQTSEGVSACSALRSHHLQGHQDGERPKTRPPTRQRFWSFTNTTETLLHSLIPLCRTLLL